MKLFTRRQPRGTKAMPQRPPLTAVGRPPPKDWIPATPYGRPRPPPLGLGGIPRSPVTPTHAGAAVLPARTPLAVQTPTSAGSHGSTPTFRLPSHTPCSPSHTTPTFSLVQECPPSHVHHVAHKAGKHTAAILVAPDTAPGLGGDCTARPGGNTRRSPFYGCLEGSQGSPKSSVRYPIARHSNSKPGDLADGAGGDDLFDPGSTGPPAQPDRLAVLSPRARSPWSRSPERNNASARSSDATSDGQYITVTAGRASAFSTSTTSAYSVEPLLSPSPDGAYEILPPIPPQPAMRARLEVAGQGMLTKNALRRIDAHQTKLSNRHDPQRRRSDPMNTDPAPAHRCGTAGRQSRTIVFVTVAPPRQPRRRSKSVPLPVLLTTNGSVTRLQDRSPEHGCFPGRRRLAGEKWISRALDLGAATNTPRPWSQGSLSATGVPTFRPPRSPLPQRIFKAQGFDVLRPRSNTAPAAGGAAATASAGADAGVGADGVHLTAPPPWPAVAVADIHVHLERRHRVVRAQTAPETSPRTHGTALDRGPSVSPPPLPVAERSFDGFVHQLEMLKLAGSIVPESPKFRRNAMLDSEQIPPQASDLAELEVAAQHQKRHGHRRLNHRSHSTGLGHSHSHSRLPHLRLPRFRRKDKTASRHS